MFYQIYYQYNTATLLSVYPDVNETQEIKYALLEMSHTLAHHSIFYQLILLGDTFCCLDEPWRAKNARTPRWVLMLRDAQELPVLWVQQEEHPEQGVQDAGTTHHEHGVQDLHYCTYNHVCCVRCVGSNVIDTGKFSF